jgi:hypothetical protein
MPSESEKKIAAPDSVEPPGIYLPACGVLCDIFWWARRNPSDNRGTAAISTPTKHEIP